MSVYNGLNHVDTRWYPTDRFVKDSVPGYVRKYTYIGADAYTAPVVAIKTNTGGNAYYYLLRDHLGSITHVITTSGTLRAEYSYDAWGRMRDPSTWITYAPGNEPSLVVADRGYTGHEHLPWFHLINMNGRVYDPLTGQFLSADNFVQAPDFSQGFNRYSYCRNNPLSSIDKNGEFFWMPVILGAVVNGMIQGIHAENKETGDFFNGFWKGAVVGAAAGTVGSAVGAGISSALAGGTFGAGFIGSSTAAVAQSSFVSGALIGGGAGFSAGFVSGFANGLIDGQNFQESLWSGTKCGVIGGVSGALISAVIGGLNAVHQNRDFWSGNANSTRDFYIDRNGIHRPVAQFKDMEKKVLNGTAPDWMKRAYYKWLNEINIQGTPYDAKCNVDLSKYGNREIYFGDYNMDGVNYQSFGNPPFDATINIQFGDYPPLVYSIDNFGLTQSSGFFSGVDRVVIGSSGMILNCNNDSFGSNLFFRLVVSHE